MTNGTEKAIAVLGEKINALETSLFWAEETNKSKTEEIAMLRKKVEEYEELLKTEETKNATNE